MDIKDEITNALKENKNPYKLDIDSLLVTRALIEMKREGRVDYEDKEKKISCDGVVIFKNVRLIESI